MRELVGLGRADLNGRRVEVLSRIVGKDGKPRFRVQLLGGVGVGDVVKVKAANLKVCDGAGEDPALSTLVEALQALAPEERRDWAGGLPIAVLAKIAEKHVAQTEAAWEAQLEKWRLLAAMLAEPGNLVKMEKEFQRLRGNCLFIFAMVCKGWRKAQLKVGGPLCTRVVWDVIAPGSVELAKWALGQGCPKMGGAQAVCSADSVEVPRNTAWNMAEAAARFGHLELVKWLCKERDFPMDKNVMDWAASGGHLETVQWLRSEGCAWGVSTCAEAARGQLQTLQWLRAEGCPWNTFTCHWAVVFSQVEVLRWARENGAPWTAEARDRAAEKFGYTDDFGNVVYGVGDD